MSITEWYARHFGIGDIDVAESAWLGDWVRRHQNSLRYSDAAQRWFWAA
jgi:hypothetical protein